MCMCVCVRVSVCVCETYVFKHLDKARLEGFLSRLQNSEKTITIAVEWECSSIIEE